MQLRLDVLCTVRSCPIENAYLPSIPGFPGLSRVSASPPGIPGESGIIPGFSISSGIPELVQIIPVQHSHVHIMCAQYSAVQPADRGEDLPYSWLFSRMKKHFRGIFFIYIWCIFWHDFRFDIRGFGQKCEIKGNKEKSRESGGSGQGKQPSRVGRYENGGRFYIVLRDLYMLRMIILRVTTGAAMKQATARLCHLWIDFALQRSRTLHENVRSLRILPRESALAAEELRPIPKE